MNRKDRLEPQPDGFVAFHTASGERWRHKDIEEAVTGPGYRLFVSDTGEERRYYFGPKEPHDVTLDDLRRHLAAASRAGADSSPDATAQGSQAPAS